MPDDKIKTYEFFTPGYSVIIQAENTFEATKKFSEKYTDKVILIIDTQYFKLIEGKVTEL